MERHDRGKSWGIEEEDMLVECWSREEVKDKLDGTVRGVVAHEIIAKYLKEHGFDRSLTSIQNKIKALKKKYHNTLAANKKSGAGRKSFKHYDLLYSILGDKPSVVARGALWVSAKF